MDKQSILQYYNDLCTSIGHKLSRAEYREVKPIYTSSLIEKLWGSWTNFVNNAIVDVIVTRKDIQRVISAKKDKVVVSYVNDGSVVNWEVFETLENYCKENKAELVLLWGKNIRRDDKFTEEAFLRLQPYLITKLTFEKDPYCIVQDFLISPTQKNPLLNLDKLSTDIKTIIVGSNKQYLRILPYKQYSTYRVACSTGSISSIDYRETVSGQIDSKYHKFGAVLLDWNEKQERYVIRNLIYKNGCICDLNKKYTTDKVTKIDTLPAMVLGDLHLPDEDTDALSDTIKFINKYKPKEVMLHDLASWNSISHHCFNHYLSKVMNDTPETLDLQTEINSVVERLTKFIKACPDSKFKVVNSNHDAFIEKWLEAGEFVKDKQNAILGAKLFVEYAQGRSIFDMFLPKNCVTLAKNTSFEVNGFELSEHGDAGISGFRGNVNSFNKTFENCICGHTHSPEIFEKTVYVGTLSKLKLNYNQKGMTKWVHCNAIVQENGSFQLIFV
jgi:hypothetical protein